MDVREFLYWALLYLPKFVNTYQIWLGLNQTTIKVIYMKVYMFQRGSNWVANPRAGNPRGESPTSHATTIMMVSPSQTGWRHLAHAKLVQILANGLQFYALHMCPNLFVLFFSVFVSQMRVMT
jgi:hypothetical protein